MWSLAPGVGLQRRFLSDVRVGGELRPYLAPGLGVVGGEGHRVDERCKGLAADGAVDPIGVGGAVVVQGVYCDGVGDGVVCPDADVF